MGCEHLDEFYELYLLGTITEGACIDIGEHLERGCPYCTEHLREAAQSVYLLTMTAHTARPNPILKSQIMKRLRKR